MPDVDVFLDVYSDLRFPLISVDLEKLRRAMQQRAQNGLRSHFGVELTGSPTRRRALVSALRGLFRKIDMPPHGIDFLARFETIDRAGLSRDIEALKSVRARFAVYELGDMLVWEEETPWPVAHSTLLQQFVNVMTIHSMRLCRRMSSCGASTTAYRSSLSQRWMSCLLTSRRFRCATKMDCFFGDNGSSISCLGMRWFAISCTGDPAQRSPR